MESASRLIYTEGMHSLHQKRVIVTGASGGLGPSIVEACLALGAHVIATARRRTALDEVRAALNHHDRLDTAECDVTDPVGLEALFDAVERKGPLWGVVHVVGGFGYGPIADLRDDEVTSLLSINLASTTLVMRGALKRMRSRGEGSFVAISSATAESNTPSFGLYGATKAAVNYLVKTATMEHLDSNIRINAVAPATMDTPDNRKAMPNANAQNWVNTRDVAATVVWLLSDESRATRGAILTLRTREAP